jgi:signal transduction histidine kinase
MWPRWTPALESAVAVFLTVIVAFEPRPGLATATRIVLAAIPSLVWILDALGARPPFLARAAIIIAAVTLLLLHPADFDAAPFFLVLLIGESAAIAEMWQSVLIAVTCAVLIVVLDITGHFVGSVIWLLAFGFAWSGSALIRSRLRLVAEIGERAAFEERQRIARELHDVIAHSLAVTMLQLTGARLALERDPADAARALLEAERLGRQSLAEIRRTVGLLAPGDGEQTVAMPSAIDIPELIREVADAGLDVHFECEGDLMAVPAAAGLSVYRIVQESLANVVKHTPGSAALVHIEVDDRTVRVNVRNRLMAVTRAGHGRNDGGLGLTLMHERAALLGGTLRAGPDGDSWQVCVEIPKQLQS